MKTLFDSVMIGNIRAKNRFIRSATWEQKALKGGRLSPDLFKLYEALADGGAGAIISSVAYITPDSGTEGMIGFYDDTFIEEYHKLSDLVHSHGSKFILQANYAIIDGKFLKPEDLSKENIRTIITSFGKAAARAKRSGFDGIQIHAAHGFLLSAFLTMNNRTDKYGGSPENNARLLFEIYDEIRTQVGNDFPVLIKINCIDQINPHKTFEACKYVCTVLAQRGLTAIEISGDNGNSSNPVSQYKESVFRNYAEKISDSISIPVILVGMNRNFSLITQILNSTQIEFFSMSRPLVCQPELINLWEKDHTIKPDCISCGKCFSLKDRDCILKKRHG